MSDMNEPVPPEAEPSPTVSSSSDNGPAATNPAPASAASAKITKPDSTRPTSLPKPSGLKQPSKIGRLCSNSAPKPAVPISPRTDGGSSESMRKLSDDLSRKHLSDLIEDEEDEVSSSLPDRPRSRRKASTSSTYSMTSMDALWEKHPRRLSEAGLRRSSDHSVVLTEDTDSFIIGERVWVGGTKPGQIAYIGETQFAPGDWAGIVLDDPIGKNDGSVAGFRYFQCSEKRGVFSRLTRLTRSPLISHDASPTSDAGSVFDRPPSGFGRPRRTLSPNGSIRSIVSSKMNASISTTANGELRLGDRVIVSSSRGSKAGTLRFVGNTEFAPGVWAGVELDDPLGKNDGSVEGKRYFECSPRFGLFAPISKVSRSPSNRKPGACAIHSNGRATPLRRSNSRESLTSLGTSIASSRVAGGRLPLGAQRMGPRAASTPVSAKNALQELLREKQHHLERLMRERELERAEVAKVSLQADRAETALAQVKKEADHASTENDKLKSELDKLNKLLEDERQKVEDLMFRNEEENINKEDYYKYKETMEIEKATREQRIRELEAEVVLQSQRAEATAFTLKGLEEQRVAETTAIAEQHKEELLAAQTLSSELQKLLDEAYDLLKEKESEKDSIGKSMSEELSKVKSEYERALNESKSKISVAQTEFETQVSVLNAKLQLAESKLEAEKQNIERLNKENSQTVIDLSTKLSQLQATLDDKTQEINKVMSVNKEHEVNVNKEITKLKMELSAKVLDLEQVEDARKKKDSAFNELQEEFGQFKEEYSSKVTEYENLLTEASQQNEKYTSEIQSLQQNLNIKTKEYEKLLTDSSNTSVSSEKIIDEYKQKIHERDKEIVKLKDDYEQVTANFNIKHSKIAEEHKKEIENRNTKIDQLIKEIEINKQAATQSKVDFEALNSQFTINLDELNSIKEENEKLKQTVHELTKLNNDLKTKISSMELEVGELQRQFQSITEKCDEIQKAKEKVESEYMNLTGQATDSNEQFNQLSQHLKETEKELQDLKDKHREVANNYGRIEQELKQKLFKLQEDFSLERSQLVRTVDEKMELIKVAENKIKELEAQIVEQSSHLYQIESGSDKLLDENSTLKSEIECLKINEKDLINDCETKCKKLEIEVDKYKDQISILKAEGASSEVKLMEKVDQLTEAQNDLNNKLEEARKHEDSLQKIVESMTSQLNHQKAQYENEISVINAQLTSITEESSKHKSEESRLIEELTQKEKSLKDLTLKLEMLEVDIHSNLELVNEKDRQIIQTNEELTKTVETKKELEEKLNMALLETTNLKQKYDHLVLNSSSDETMMKEQLNQLESLKKEVNALSCEKETLNTKLNEDSNELTKLKTEKQELLTKFQENEKMNIELKKSLDENINIVNSQKELIEGIKNRLKQLDDEIIQHKEEISNKNSEIVEKESQLKILNEALKLGSNETQHVINQLQNDNTELGQKHRKEVESLNKTIKSLETKLKEQDKMFEELKETKDKVAELQQLLIKSETDIKQLTNINEGQKSNYEDLNKQLQLQYDEHRKESKRKRNDLRTRLETYEAELKESKDEVNLEMEKHKELEMKLSVADKHITELTNKLELALLQQSTNVEKNEQLEKITLELQATRKASNDAIAQSESLINNLRADVESKIKELKQKEESISKLQEDLRNYKAKIDIVEREKIMLQKELSANVKDKNDNNAMGTLGQGDNATKKSVEEKEMIDGQVSFLNSVIVDMQRKNEQLMARVQALEGGAVSVSPVFNGRKPRAVAPRLFCDICDVFDAHDTEDCPKQCADPDAPVLTPGKKKPPPRPYCDICEVFGHSTEDCDEEETF